MAVKSWPGIAVGVTIAIAVPVAYRVLAELIIGGVVPLDRDGTLFPIIRNFETSVLATSILGLIGLRIAGRAAGIQNGGIWAVLVLVGMPVLLGFWFICYATFGGAVGSPF